MSVSSVASLQQRRSEIGKQLADVSDMRPGSLVERFRRCGKPSCHCAEEGARGHGPQFSLTRPVRGKTVTRIIPKGPAVERTRKQLGEYQRFRKLVSEFVAVSEQICDAELEQQRNAEAEGDKKNRTRRTAGRRTQSRH